MADQQLHELTLDTTVESGDLFFKVPSDNVTSQQPRRTRIQDIGQYIIDNQLGSLATLSAVDTAQLADDAVTFAKMQNLSADTIIGSAAGGDPEEITITSFGRSLIDDVDATAARTTLGVDAAGTDNSTDVTLAGTPDYLTLSGQEITLNAVDLSTDVTGNLPIGSLNTTGTADNTTFLRGDGAWTVPTTDAVSEGSNLYFTNERVDDRINTLLVAGTNITLTYDDGANTLTIDASGGGGASQLSELSDVDSSVGSPSDGDIMVYRSAGSDWVLEAKPVGGSNPALNDVTDVNITSVGDNELLAYDSTSGDWINQTPAEAGLAEASHTHDAADITSGTFADGRVAESNVTQHEAALTITESQISDLGTYQTQDAELTAIAGLVSAANQLPYFTGSGTAGLTTITAFGRSILDDADAAAVRTTIGVDPAGTDNSTPVTFSGTLDYITLAGQEITVNAIDLNADVSGTLPITSGGTGASSAAAARVALDLEIGVDVQAHDAELDALASITSAANTVPVFTGSGTASGISVGVSQLFGRGATGGLTPITLGTNLSMSGTTLNATGGDSGDLTGATVTDNLSFDIQLSEPGNADNGAIRLYGFGNELKYKDDSGNSGIITRPLSQPSDTQIISSNIANFFLDMTDATWQRVPFYFEMANDDSHIGVRFSQDGGSNFDSTSGDYKQLGIHFEAGGFNTYSDEASGTEIRLTSFDAGQGIGNDAGQWCYGVMDIYGAGDSSVKTMVNGWVVHERDSYDRLSLTTFSGLATTAAVDNAVQFISNSTNQFASGEAKIYDMQGDD